MAGCGPGTEDANGDGGGAGEDAGPTGMLEIAPGDVTLTVTDGAVARQAYTATLRALDGSTTDVTASAFFIVDNVQLGSFASATLSTTGLAGGTGTVSVSYQGLQAQSQLTVNIVNRRVVQGAPADAPDLFDGAAEDPAQSPTILYPSDTTLVPPNLGDFEVHWMENGGADLFEVRLAGAFVDLRLYLPGTPNAGNWTAYLVSEWAIAGMSERGKDLTVTVRAMNRADTTKAGTSEAISVALGEQDLEGGIYYWASVAANNEPAGVYRHDVSRAGQAAERFYTTAESPNGRCVACHVLSRDGTRMAITYDGGNGASSIVDVATRAELLATDGTFKWNFATYEPDGSRIITVSEGTMVLRNADTGAVLAPVPTGGPATHPDFSPTGDKIVYIAKEAVGQDWVFSQGSVVVLPFDPAAGTFGSPTTVVPGGPGINNYYPSWSPDGQWIVFNRSTEDAYDDASAEVWILKADGSVGPVKIDSPNVGGGLTNSWVRWAPFAQQLSGDRGDFFWFTFSSKRAFGVRLANGARPQIWMAPFFPDRLVAGEEPSAPAFRSPFQSIDSSNHIAQWTEQVIPID